MAAQPLSVAPEGRRRARFPGTDCRARTSPSASAHVVPPRPYVTVVLPCYNEQDHVLDEIARISAALDASGYTYELLAIDDKSTDETLARLRSAEKTYPKLARRRVPPQRRLGHGPPHRHPRTRAARSSSGPTPT